jgi:hypothetical protein
MTWVVEPYTFLFIADIPHVRCTCQKGIGASEGLGVKWSLFPVWKAWQCFNHRGRHVGRLSKHELNSMRVQSEVFIGPSAGIQALMFYHLGHVVWEVLLECVWVCDCSRVHTCVCAGLGVFQSGTRRINFQHLAHPNL